MAKDCCWNCKYYIPPSIAFKKVYMLDGPIHSVCTIDRKKSYYSPDSELAPGDKDKEPGDWCERYEEREYGE